MICNDEDTDGRAKVTTEEERVLYLKTEQRSVCVGSQVGRLSELCR